ncbi:MAG: hypothetical protein EXR20_05420 [Bacteroidetes bacterium]|nr:hypothetical protein [Bacteroidota bacterium]
MEKKITSVEITETKHYVNYDSKWTISCHYLDLTLENVDGIDPRSIVSAIINFDEENIPIDESVKILKITNPDGEIIGNEKDLKEINSNKDLRLSLYRELTDSGILDDDDDDDYNNNDDGE